MKTGAIRYGLVDTYCARITEGWYERLMGPQKAAALRAKVAAWGRPR